MANDKDFLLKNAVEVGGPTKVTLGSITSSDIDLATGNYFAETLAANTTYTLSNAGDVQAFQLEVTGGAVLTDNLGDAASVGNYDTLGGGGLFFKPDGTKFWKSGGSTITAYSMSTAWDVTTTSADGVTFSTSSQDSDIDGLWFNSDGTRMFAAGSDTNDVYEYHLSTAWDISTASFDSSFSTSANFNNNVSFNSAGTVMLVTDQGNDRVYQYSLSAFDVSTASLITSFSYASLTENPTQTVFNSDGTKMYMISTNQGVVTYDLSTAYNVSTASLDSTQSISTNGQSIFFDSTSSNFYAMSGGIIYQYILSVAATVTWPSSIEWAGGVAPSAPANGETDVYTLVTDDGGTSYVGVKTADNLS